MLLHRNKSVTSSQERYEGIQTLLDNCGSDGCLFLCVLSIAEEATGKPVDLIDTIHHCIKKGWLTETFFVKDSLAILCYLTQKDWTRQSVSSLPFIGPNDYSVAIYYNDRTRYTHYRRRSYDTLKSSVTVKEGYIRGYYVYSWG